MNTRGLRLSPSGRIVTADGKMCSVEEAVNAGLLEGKLATKLLRGEKLKKYNLTETASGNFIGKDGNVFTFDDLKKQGVVGLSDLNILNELQMQEQDIKCLEKLEKFGLTATESGRLITKSGKILTVEDLKHANLVDDFDLKLLLEMQMRRESLAREKRFLGMLDKYGLRATSSGQLITQSGKIVTIEDLQASGVVDPDDLKFLQQMQQRGRALPLEQRELADSVTRSKTVSSASSVEADVILTQDVKYLKAVIGKPIVLALAEVCTKQPRDPIHYLGHWLFKYRYNQEIDDVKKKEIMELEEERERLRKEKTHRDIEDAARECLIEMAVMAHDYASKERFEEILREQAMSEGEENDLAEEAKDTLGELAGPALNQKGRV